MYHHVPPVLYGMWFCLGVSSLEQLCCVCTAVNGGVNVNVGVGVTWGFQKPGVPGRVGEVMGAGACVLLLMVI